MIDTALSLAIEAHKGQRDKSGKAYILHPLRIMAKMTTEEEQSVAILHDVLEDSDFQLSDLLSAGIPVDVCRAVELLTRIDGQDYERYIDDIAQNTLARRVKIADIEDNINVLRLRDLGDRDIERLKKYHKSWHILIDKENVS